MLKTLFSWLLLLMAIFFIGCFDSAENKAIQIEKIPEEKLDSLSNWFALIENFNDKHFYTKFYQNYQQKLASNQWKSAATLLIYAGESIYMNNSSDSLFIKTSIDFLNKYSDKIYDYQEIHINNNIGILYYYLQNTQKSFQYLNEAAKNPAKDSLSLINKAVAFKELSYNYSNIGQLDQALSNAIKALEIAVVMKDTLGIGGIYDAMANTYHMMNDHKNTEIYYEKAIKMLSSVDSKDGVFATSLNKIALYDEMESPKLYPAIDSLMNYYNRSNFNNDSYKLYIYSWYSYKLLREKKIEEAKKYLFEVLPIFKNIESQFIFDIYLISANLYKDLTNETIISSEIYTNALEKYKENKDYPAQITCYDALISEAEKRKDYKLALKYTEELHLANDSLFNKTLTAKAKELDKKYQNEKKEQQIRIQQQEITQKNTQIALLVASLIGLLLAVFAFYLWQRQKLLKKEKMNSMIFTKQLFENTEDERKRIAGDLHDSISHELLNLKNVLSSDIELVSKKIDIIINDIRGISRNLHPVMFDKIGLIPNVEQLVERIQNYNNLFISTDFRYEGTLASADELQIYRVIQEALTNIIKYAEAHAVKITIAEQKDKIFIEIKDNGKGFDVKQTLNSSKAFGLHNIIERSRVIGGEANIRSSAEGTIISVNIPKKS